MTVIEAIGACDFCDVPLRPVPDLARHGCARCPECGCVMCLPRPALSATIEQYQDVDYYTEFGRYDPADLMTLVDSFRDLARQMRQALGPGGQVLEVGCAAGPLLAALRDEGLRVQGFDVSAVAVAQARAVFGVDAQQAFVEGYEIPPDVDAIVSLHVLEHLLHPAEFLGKVATALRPGARLVLEVPDYGAWTRRRLGEDWPHLRPGQHLQHFDEGCLKLLCRRAGFRVDRLERIGGLGLLDHTAAHEAATREGRFGQPRGWRGRLYDGRRVVYRVPAARAAVRTLNDLVGYRLLHRNANIRVWAHRR